ncbi:ATP-binding protein, partial [Micromonospora zhanjiangensis]
VPRVVLDTLGRRTDRPGETVGLAPRDTMGRLVDTLSTDETLIVLDNCEHVVDAAARLAGDLLGRCPGLRVLATSREPLGILGEVLDAVPPLRLPPADAAPVDALAYPSVQLLRDRAAAVRSGFAVTDDNVADVVEICRRLDGLPLAIELAAARGRILDLNEILDRYGDRLLDLAGPPIRREAVAVTLRDAVAGSYRLLEPVERAALRRLSAFRNRWSVELAEAMLVDLTGDPVPVLDRLLALGLIGARGSGPVRFRLLDVVRDFAAERAAADGELAVIRRRHAVVFARFAQRAAPDLVGASMPAAVNQLDEVTSDLWAALAYAANDDPHSALR